MLGVKRIHPFFQPKVSSRWQYYFFKMIAPLSALNKAHIATQATAAVMIVVSATRHPLFGI
jgi:hypothetical protein